MDNTQFVVSPDVTNELTADIGETTATAWTPPQHMTFDQWVRVGNTLNTVSGAVKWWIGDWLNYGERKWGETYAQAMDQTDWSYSTLSDCKYVSGKIEFSLRKENLSWSHHLCVAKLEHEDQRLWLETAERDGLSVSKLREAIKASQQPAIPQYTNGTHPPADDDTDDMPFNHKTRWDVPAAERTPVDEYEQQADEYAAEPIGCDPVNERSGIGQCKRCRQMYDAAKFATCPYCERERTGGNLYAAFTSEYLKHIESFDPKAESMPPGDKMTVHYSSESPEHYTPAEIIDAAVACLGSIDLDPCSNSVEPPDIPNIPANHHFTARDDGLMHPWVGTVYMNPPYGREIPEWIDKLVNEYEAGNTTAAIALVPSRTDTQWWIKLRDFPVCLVEGRLKFLGNNEVAPFPSAVFYLGADIEKFYHAFCPMGDIWQRIEPGMFGA